MASKATAKKVRAVYVKGGPKMIPSMRLAGIRFLVANGGARPPIVRDAVRKVNEAIDHETLTRRLRFLLPDATRLTVKAEGARATAKKVRCWLLSNKGRNVIIEMKRGDIEDWEQDENDVVTRGWFIADAPRRKPRAVTKGGKR